MAKSKKHHNLKQVAFIAFSDVHITNYSKFDEGNRRLLNGLDVLKRIKLLCMRYKCPSLFMGDLFDREKGLTNKVLSHSLPLFSKLWGSGTFNTYAITGNHDQSEQNYFGKSSYSYIHTLSKTFKNLHCLDFSKQELEDFHLYGVPYITHDMGLIDYINNIYIDPTKENILMLHTTMPNAKDTDGREINSYIASNEFDKAIARFDLVLCGHIHSPHDWKTGKTIVIQVGAPQHQRFTDRNCDMGYWVIYKNLEYEFVPFKRYPKFVELEEKEKAPDNKNFYVHKPKKQVSKKDDDKRDFSNTVSRRKIARNYLKEKGIKDKEKKQALITELNKTKL